VYGIDHGIHYYQYGCLVLCDVCTGEQTFGLGFDGGVYSMGFSLDGNAVAIGWSLNHRRGDYIELWGTKTRELLAWLSCPGTPLAIWFDPFLPQLRVATAGEAAGVPNVYVLEIVRREV
jgi:hypothetical protein